MSQTIDIKYIQLLAQREFGKEQAEPTGSHSYPEGQRGVVLLTRQQDVWICYGWKNALRDPQHEEPGSLAVDLHGNIWIANGGNDYDGAEHWELLHKQSVYIVVNPTANTNAEYFCPQEAAKKLADTPVDDCPYVLHVQAVGESLNRENGRVITSVSRQQKPGEEPSYTVALDLKKSRDSQFTEAYLKAALNL